MYFEYNNTIIDGIVFLPLIYRNQRRKEICRKKDLHGKRYLRVH